MQAFNGGNNGRTEMGMHRRDFLHAGAVCLGAASPLWSVSLLGSAAGAARSQRMNCIVLFLVGGPSHIDTWDPKPYAPANVRGPFQPIKTNVAGVHLSECFPQMARRADRFAIVRSVFHDGPAIHEVGQQLLQTGRVCHPGTEEPSLGAIVSRTWGPMSGSIPTAMTVPGPIGNTGVSISHGQGAGWLGLAFEPRCPAPGIPLPPVGSRIRAAYGDSAFGQSCLLARRLVETGTRFVTVNMFDTVFNEMTWDCHADGGSLAVTLDDYRTTLCPMFDQAYSALLDDLEARGLLETTMVVAMGEFGRTPHLNPRGGRDHWPHAWSVLFAGGAVRGGQVIGATDSIGAEVIDRPVPAAAIAASILHGIGLGPAVEGGLAIVDPVHELFGG